MVLITVILVGRGGFEPPKAIADRFTGDYTPPHKFKNCRFYRLFSYFKINIPNPNPTQKTPPLPSDSESVFLLKIIELQLYRMNALYQGRFLPPTSETCLKNRPVGLNARPNQLSRCCTPESVLLTPLR